MAHAFSAQMLTLVVNLMVLARYVRMDLFIMESIVPVLPSSSIKLASLLLVGTEKYSPTKHAMMAIPPMVMAAPLSAILSKIIIAQPPKLLIVLFRPAAKPSVAME